MPQRRRGPRLYLKRAYGGRAAVWIVRDGTKSQSTGCSPHEFEEARRALERYLASTHQAPKGANHPSKILVTEVLAAYRRVREPKLARPDMLSYSMPHLVAFWGDDYLSAITGARCREYVEQRTAKGVSEQTARRDLETLRAAIRLYHKEYGLAVVPAVSMPEKAEGRQRWLTRGEVARLLWAARHSHVGRFILIGLYTGTRSKAILGLSWLPTTRSGWIDVEHGILYRRGVGRRTKKRAEPAPIPPRLLPFLRRWRKRDLAVGVTHVIHFQGEAIKKLRRSWTTARKAAGLEKDVTPHVLRHTTATWLMQRGVPLWEVSGYLSMTVQTLQQTYGHHHPDHQKQAANAFSRRP